MDLTEAYTCPSCLGVKPYCICLPNYWTTYSKPSNKEKTINKYFTKKLGYCWYKGKLRAWVTDTSQYKGACRHCVLTVNRRRSFFSKNCQKDFFTEENFFTLWKWAIAQDWWNPNFLPYFYIQFPGCTLVSLVDPSVFASVLYTFLQGHENGKW